MLELVKLERHGAIATIRLSRPEKLNALLKPMWLALSGLLKTLDADEHVRCIVLRGAGGNFCAGADIGEFNAERADSTHAKAYGALMHQVLFALRDGQHPTIAAIEGVCAGAGLELALMCDLRLAADGARLGLPVARLGVTLPGPEFSALLEAVGRANALELLLETRLWGAVEAASRGLVNRVVMSERFEEELAATAQRIAVGAPLSHRYHRQFARRLSDPRPLAEAEFSAGYACFDTRDCRAAVEAFLKKEAPRFEGR